VADAVHEAAKNGDRSENGDYIYGKRRLREIDSRVRFLRKRLDELEVVTRTPDDTAPGFLRRLGHTRGRIRGGRWAGVLSGPMNSISPTASSAWIHRWRARCSANGWTMKSVCRARRA
jgi:hypothetical protein